MKTKSGHPRPGKPFAWLPRGKRFIPAKSLAACAKVYRQAAQAVFDAIKSKHGSVEAYPLVFLYRHSIEAYIKSILMEFGSEIGIKKEEVRLRGHDLCKQLPDLLRVSLEAETRISRLTESAINQLNSIDPGSDSVRYDENFPSKEFDLEHFRSEMERILDEMECLHAELSNQHYQQLQDTILGSNRRS